MQFTRCLEKKTQINPEKLKGIQKNKYLTRAEDVNGKYNLSKKIKINGKYESGGHIVIDIF